METNGDWSLLYRIENISTDAFSLSADGTVLAIGGAVIRVFKYNEEDESIAQLGDGIINNQLFGLSSDGTRLVGYNYMDNTVEVYQYNNNNGWTKIGTFENTTMATISGDGTRVAVIGGNGVSVHQYSGNNQWTLLGNNINIPAVDIFLSADGTRLVVNSTNAANIYQYDGYVWVQLDRISQVYSFNSNGDMVTSTRGIYKLSDNNRTLIQSPIENRAVVLVLSPDGNRVASINSSHGTTDDLNIYQIGWIINNGVINRTLRSLNFIGEIFHPVSFSKLSFNFNSDGSRAAVIQEGYVNVYQYNPPMPIGNICFMTGTPVLTDQGNVPIERIIPDHHTINQKPILAVTQSRYASDKYLVCLEKDCLAQDVPSQQTIVSMNHRILYQGRMIKAKDLKIKGVKGVTYLEYCGEILYNILLAKYDIIMVNNMICESLDPNHDIAKLYLKLDKMEESERKNIIKHYNAEYKSRNSNSDQKLIFNNM